MQDSSPKRREGTLDSPIAWYAVASFLNSPLRTAGQPECPRSETSNIPEMDNQILDAMFSRMPMSMFGMVWVAAPWVWEMNLQLECHHPLG